MKFNWLNITGSLAAELSWRSIRQVFFSLEDAEKTDLILCRFGQISFPKESGRDDLNTGQAFLCSEPETLGLEFSNQANVYHFHFSENSLKFTETNCRLGRCWQVDKEFLVEKKDIVKYGVQDSWQQIFDDIECSNAAMKDQLQSFKVEAFLGALYLLCDNMKSIRIAQSNKSLMTYQSIKNDLLEQFYNKLSRESIAQEMGISEIQISKLFQRFDDCTFKQTLVGIRLEFVSVLLSNPQIKTEHLSQIAQFRNKENFSQAFKKYFGYTPYEMRKRIKGGEVISYKFLPQSFHLDSIKNAELSPQETYLYKTPEKGHMVPFFVLNFSGQNRKHYTLGENNEFKEVASSDSVVSHYLATKGRVFYFHDENDGFLGTYTIGDTASVLAL